VNIDALKPMFLPSNVGAMASGMEAVTKGVTIAASQGALPAADAIIRDFAPPALTPTTGPVSLGEAAGFPGPADFLRNVKNLPPAQAEALQHLADPQFSPAKSLADCVENVFRGGGLVDRLIGRDGLLNPVLGGLTLSPSESGKIPGDDLVGRRTIGDAGDQVGRRTIGDKLDQVGRRTIGDELDQVGRRGIGSKLDEVGRRTIGDKLDEVGRRTIGDELDQVGRRGIGSKLDEVGRRTIGDKLDEVGRRTIGDELDQVGRRGIGSNLDEVGRRTIGDKLDEVGRRTIGDKLDQVGRRTIGDELDQSSRSEGLRGSIPASDLLVGLGESVGTMSQLKDIQSSEGIASLGLLRNHLAVLDRFEGAVRDIDSLHREIADSRRDEEHL
jgi:hypothetical protein